MIHCPSLISMSLAGNSRLNESSLIITCTRTHHAHTERKHCGSNTLKASCLFVLVKEGHSYVDDGGKRQIQNVLIHSVHIVKDEQVSRITQIKAELVSDL